MTPEAQQTELNRYKEIVLTAIDYLIERTAGRFKWDDVDPHAQYYSKLKEKADKYYRNKNLSGLKKLLQKITEQQRQASDLGFNSYIKSRTGYDIDIFADTQAHINELIKRGKLKNEKEYREIVIMANVLRQTAADPGKLATLDRIRLAFEEKKDTRQLKSSKGENNVPKELSNALSPNQKHRLIVTKHAIGEENASTQVSLNTPDGGAGVYGVKGVDLAVKAYWKDNDTIIIETKKDYQVQSRACRQLQIFNNIFSIALIES